MSFALARSISRECGWSSRFACSVYGWVCITNDENVSCLRGLPSPLGNSCKFVQGSVLIGVKIADLVRLQRNTIPNCVIALRCLRKLRDKIHGDVVPLPFGYLGLYQQS
ncbi:hypothetical protein Tco_0246034 [Tanacetum coccineum]